jgi:hypothetical protein
MKFLELNEYYLTYGYFGALLPNPVESISGLAQTFWRALHQKVDRSASGRLFSNTIAASQNTQISSPFLRNSPFKPPTHPIAV